jgi:hypothetical protein
MNDAERQRILDEEHLKLLRIGYIVAGVVNCLFSVFPLIYVAMGIYIASMGRTIQRRSDAPDPAFMGLIFIIIGLAASFIAVGAGVLKLVAASAIKKRRSRPLVLVAAAVSCLSLPYGTVLGIFTFMVLSRQSVARLFDSSAPSSFSPVPQASLFTEHPPPR